MKKNIDKKDKYYEPEESYHDYYDYFSETHQFLNKKFLDTNDDELSHFDNDFMDDEEFMEKEKNSFSAINSHIFYLLDNYYFLFDKFNKTINLFDSAVFQKQNLPDEAKFRNQITNIKKMIGQVENDLFYSNKFNTNQIIKNYLKHPVSQLDNFPVELLFSHEENINDNLNNFFIIHNTNPLNEYNLSFLLTILQQLNNFKTPEEHSNFFTTVLLSLDNPSPKILNYLLNECPYVIQYLKPYDLNEIYKNRLLLNKSLDKYSYSSNSSAFEVNSTISYLFKNTDFKTIETSDILTFSENNPNTIGTYLSHKLPKEHPIFQPGNESDFFKLFSNNSAFSIFMQDYHWKHIINENLLPILVNYHKLYLDNAPKFLTEDFEYLLKMQEECSFLFNYIKINEEQAIKLLSQAKTHFKSQYACETGIQIIIKSLKNIDFSNKNENELKNISNYIIDIIHSSDSSIFTKDSRIFRYIPDNLANIMLNSEIYIEPFFFLKAAIKNHSQSDLNFILKDISTMNNTTVGHQDSHFFPDMLRQINITFKTDSFDFSYLLRIFQEFPLKKWDNSFNNEDAQKYLNINNTISSILNRCSNKPSDINDWHSFSAYIEKLNIEKDLASIVQKKDNIVKPKKIKF